MTNLKILLKKKNLKNVAQDKNTLRKKIRINIYKKNTPAHVILNLQKAKDKGNLERNLAYNQETDMTYVSADFPSEATQARRK